MPIYCKGDNCKDKKKQASYNFAGLKPKYCSRCKLVNMINLKHQKCIVCNDKYPSFNIPTKKNALYCNDCKEDTMIDVATFKCIICKNKQPNFNISTEQKALYCNDCKEDGMVDIKHHKCIICNDKRPSFNLSGETKALYCNDCKLVDMVNIVSSKCITESCDKLSAKDNYCMRCYYFHNPSKKTKAIKSKI